MVINRIAEQSGISLGKVQMNALVGEGLIADKKAILAKPQTSMNLSGNSIGPLVNYYQISDASILVIFDDIDLPLGTLRLREKGGSGGHNGMKSIINHLGQDFARLRIGIGRPPGRMEPADYVLQNFREEEIGLVDELLDRSAEATRTFIKEGIDSAMSRFNGAIE